MKSEFRKRVFTAVMMAWLGIGVLAQEAQADGLTRVEQSRVLRAIDNDCADTWCEGDYDYRFDSIRCQFERRVCRLGFRAGLRSASAGSFRWSIRTHCMLSGIASMGDLLQQMGQYESLKESAYEQINQCIDYRIRESERSRDS
jgi:hypothetical protein